MRTIIWSTVALFSLVCCVSLLGISGRLQAQQDEVEFDFADDLEFGVDEPDFQLEELEPAQIAIVVIVGAIVFAIGLAILIFILILLSGFLKALPSEHRQMDPVMVWLLLIPCFNLVWNFFVYQRISASYQSYFQSIGRTDVGDCGGTLGLWYAICAALGLIPCVNYLAGPASLVLLIIYLVKLSGLKKQVQAKPQTPFA